MPGLSACVTMSGCKLTWPPVQRLGGDVGCQPGSLTERELRGETLEMAETERHSDARVSVTDSIRECQDGDGTRSC